jgi:hypothetical protein|tara:strand:+ start:389 stop:520 length:132 start_codon:yes stop_codon:yes gene_type:complete
LEKLYNFGGSFIPSHRILKIYFTQLKTLMGRQQKKKTKASFAK